ncbi:DNA-directed RNA polymerase I subunit RPA34.5-domain-containing protein [Ampelomyces quisqualis]|uniref:DNA-directed RNA polymerase I subunit RPA34.5-domain-containing protein n=1 Tax=Ampelomyces quisqualis TaxID=50730 RepID=A0A6A5R022_AMPQU|nr:DNA-directed RNA polymerase I subunit RPA34.5-domain-containing protein [Ampelomyces quisqualis]
MKEMKKTPVPLPVLSSKLQAKSKSKPEPKASTVPAKGALSQEFVGSDDDSSPEEPRQPKPKTTIAVHRPNGAVKTKTASNAKAAPQKAAPKQVVTQAQAAELSSSEQTDDDDESLLNGAPQLTQKPAQAQARTQHARPHTAEIRPAQAYVPPKGFDAVPCNDRTTSKSAHVFSNLEGKQIWHMTAPAGVSVSELKEIAMDRAMGGEAVLYHKGTGYGLSNTGDANSGACMVMIPQKDGYKAVSARISQSLRLRAEVQLPRLSSKQADVSMGSEAAASITRSTIRAPRPQLKGLKMRFMPTGFGGGHAGTLGNSDSEEDTPQGTAGLGLPRELNLPSRKEKRKHAAVNGDDVIEPPKKQKKQRSTEALQRKEERRAIKERKRAQEAAAAKS